MTKILITGVAGHIGSIAADLFLERGYQLVGIDNFATGFREPIAFLEKKYGKDKFRFYEADLKQDLSPIFEKETNIEAVVHYAASAVVSESMQDPAKYFGNNICGSNNLFATLAKYKIKKLVFSSTCAVYGDAEHTPINEQDLLKPNNPYGESKLGVEKMLYWYGQIKELSYVILRYFNVPGASADGELGYSKKPATHLVENAVRGALKIADFYLTCPEVDTPDKTPIRDYVNILDLNEAHILAVEYLLKGGKSEIINLGTGTGNSVLEVVKTVEEVTGQKISFQKGSPRPGEAVKLVADNKKAKDVLGWQPKRTLKESIESLVKWFSKHPYGWRK